VSLETESVTGYAAWKAANAARWNAEPTAEDRFRTRMAAESEVAYPKQDLGATSKPVHWRCRDCRNLFVLQGTVIPAHKLTTGQLCPSSNTEPSRALSAVALQAHVVAAVMGPVVNGEPAATRDERRAQKAAEFRKHRKELRDAKLNRRKAAAARWLYRIELLGHVPDGCHGRVRALKEFANVLADAGARLSAASRLYFEMLELSDSLMDYLAATCWAMGTPIAFEGGCNDENSTEQPGNGWGFVIDALFWDRKHRSWQDRIPRTRQTTIGGERAGTYTGRWGRENFSRAEGGRACLRKDRRGKGPFESWRKAKDGTPWDSTGHTFEKPFIASVLYLTGEQLREVEHNPALMELAGHIKDVCRVPHSRGGMHEWLFNCTQDARMARRVTYTMHIAHPSDRAGLWWRHRNKRNQAKTAERIAAKWQLASYQTEKRELSETGMTGADRAGSFLESSTGGTRGSGKDPPL
jgi:hypothetical protein